MAFEPYLSERLLGDCPVRPSCGQGQFDPSCTVDERRQLARDRWSLLRSDPCQLPRLTPPGDPCMNLRADAGFCKNDLCRVKGQGQICEHGIGCAPPVYDKGRTTYGQHFKYPKSHNAIDDCCRAPCPCDEKFPELPSNIYYCATEPETCPPLDTCTTYRHFYVPHQLAPRQVIKKAAPDPCECPMEQCTITRSDYTRKEAIPNGPSPTEILKPGLWSTSQFCKEFTDDTTTRAEFGPKCTERRVPYKMVGNIGPCECCPMREDTTTRVDFRPKVGEDPCYPPWISNDEYRKPDTNMESCTTYGHFYRPHCIQGPLQSLQVGTPGAIPFCTINNLCYSGHDPEPNQKPTVEMRDNDPWPTVKRTPFRYTDNLQTDPCAPFRDETIYKTDFYAKSTCGRRPSTRPTVGYVRNLVPFNDDTTMKVSYPPYTLGQYKEAFGDSGNPNGIKWDVFTCNPQTDKCLPRFVSPYGNPLKPFLQGSRCPCGPFDNRSSYNRDFIFRNREIAEMEEVATCRQLNVPKGDSLSRSSFIVVPGGKKATVMEPPTSKGHRCMNPSSFRDTDTLYRLNYQDFWKSLERQKLELYRGQSTHRPKKSCPEGADVDVETQVLLVPVYPNKGKPEVMSQGITDADSDFKWPQRYKDIPYSGANIMNRANTALICHGYQ